MNAQFAAMRTGLDMIYVALEAKRLRCTGDYDVDEVCGWEGRLDFCDKLNGGLLCPDCGSRVREVRG